MGDRTSIRRTFSGTPLAARYDSVLAGGRRSRVAIPWERFDRSAYPAEALALATDAAERLAEGEYHAIGLFGRIASGLAMSGAPFDIVAEATGVSRDELRHADYCTRFAALCSGREPELSLDRAALDRAAPNLPRTLEVDFLVAKYAATGETLAAALLLACRKRARDPVARALFGALLSDETHHARLGWYYLSWRAPQWTPAEQQAIADPLGEFVASIEDELWHGRDASPAARDAADALGVLDTEAQRAAVRDVMESEILPGLDALGLGASHAWKRRTPGGTSRRARRGVVFGAPERRASGEEADRAAAWLAARVHPDGGVDFAVDATTSMATSDGPMVHARRAIVVAALEAHGGHPTAARAAGARLEADLLATTRGASVPGFPQDPTLAAATVALAVLAGVDAKVALRELAGDASLRRSAWYAAEVVAALGPSTPRVLWAACVEALDREPWAPWTAIAARAVRDDATYARCAAVLAASVGEDGAVRGPSGAEIARTAIVVEALSPGRSGVERDAIRRATGFLSRSQLESGALPLVPGGNELRVDATAHALLAWMSVLGGS